MFLYGSGFRVACFAGMGNAKASVSGTATMQVSFFVTISDTKLSILLTLNLIFMKNFKFLAPFALGLLLTLGACEKDSKSSGGGDDPSTPEGKIEMAIAAIGTDGDKFISKLEKKGWSLYDDDDFEGIMYSKGDNEGCYIVFDEDNHILVVQWMDSYDDLSDAKEALSDYHSATTEKYNKGYSAYCGSYSFDNPSDFIKYVNSAKESELGNDVSEHSMNSKEGVQFYNRLQNYYKSWKVIASVVSIDY